MKIDWKRSLGRKDELYAQALAGEIPFDVGDVYERLTPKQSGQFLTPACVAKLMARLLRSNGKSVYDPACGTGRLLAASGGRSLCGQELSAELSAMALAHLGGPQRAMIICADTLKDPAFHRTFNVVMANPPFEGGTDVWVRHCIEHVESDALGRLRDSLLGPMLSGEISANHF